MHWPNDWYYCIIEVPLGSLYVNALLTNLNARRYVTNARPVVHEFSAPVPLTSLRFRQPNLNTGSGSGSCTSENTGGPEAVNIDVRVSRPVVNKTLGDWTLSFV